MGRSTFEVQAKSHDHDDDDKAPSEGRVVMPGQDNRIVFLHGMVTEQTIAGIIAQLLFLAGQNSRPIHLVLSTYGGSVDEMFSLYDTIKFLPCPVHTVALGKVMSAGVLLLASGVKGKRLIGASSRVMIHPISGGAMGNIFEVENQTKEMRSLQDRMVTMLARETKMKKRYIERFVMGKIVDHYVTPQEAIELGIADKVIGSNE